MEIFNKLILVFISFIETIQSDIITTYLATR